MEKRAERTGRRLGALELKTEANRNRRTKDGDKNESLPRSGQRKNRASGGEKRSWHANLLTDENRNKTRAKDETAASDARNKQHTRDAMPNFSIGF
jgi:hypothetical protein